MKKYYCNGLCESCDKGKYYKGKGSYTCDPDKIKELQIIAPIPPSKIFRSK